ncbi:MAG: DUF374 domain-containing protein [Ignavibacteria bacterium]
MMINVGILLLRLIASSWRYSHIGSQPDKHVPSIIVFWHEHMLAGWHAHRYFKPRALVSKSKDGAILSKILHGWGIHTIRGSSSNSGKEALELVIDSLEAGMHIVMTPDGPRGPRQVFKPGASIASIRADVPIYLARIHELSCFTFNKSWDAFKLPLPFSRIEISYDVLRFTGNPNDKEEVSTFISACENTLKEKL